MYSGQHIAKRGHIDLIAGEVASHLLFDNIVEVKKPASELGGKIAEFFVGRLCKDLQPWDGAWLYFDKKLMILVYFHVLSF